MYACTVYYSIKCDVHNIHMNTVFCSELIIKPPTTDALIFGNLFFGTQIILFREGPEQTVRKPSGEGGALLSSICVFPRNLNSIILGLGSRFVDLSLRTLDLRSGHLDY